MNKFAIQIHIAGVISIAVIIYLIFNSTTHGVLFWTPSILMSGIMEKGIAKKIFIKEHRIYFFGIGVIAMAFLFLAMGASNGDKVWDQFDKQLSTVIYGAFVLLFYRLLIVAGRGRKRKEIANHETL